MNAKLYTICEKLRTSFWFVPTLMIGGALVAHAITLHLDYHVDETAVNRLPLVYRDGIEGARSLCNSAITALMTVTGVTFSVTIVSFALASSQFSPRLLRNFMRDTGNQVVLGTLISTFTYSIFVLRVVGGPSGDFIPRISVTCVFWLTIASIAAIVYFIHHASSLIQGQAIIADVGRELDASIKTLFPEELSHELSDDKGETLPADFRSAAVGVHAARSDYLEAIDQGLLIELAEHHDLLVVVECRPGSFVGTGELLALVSPFTRASEEISCRVRKAFFLGAQRTQTQDPEFILMELVEIAVRALSPGVNDPATAVQCVDRLGAALAQVAARGNPTRVHYGQSGALRLISKSHDFRDLADAAFNQIRQNAQTSAPVTIRLLEAIRRVARRVVREKDCECLRRHAEMIERGSKALPEPLDRKDVEDRFRLAISELDRRSSEVAR